MGHGSSVEGSLGTDAAGGSGVVVVGLGYMGRPLARLVGAIPGTLLREGYFLLVDGSSDCRCLVAVWGEWPTEFREGHRKRGPRSDFAGGIREIAAAADPAEPGVFGRMFGGPDRSVSRLGPVGI